MVQRGWLMYSLTGSALQLGLATATRGLPLLFFGVLAAPWQIVSRKGQLIVAQVTNADSTVTLATLVCCTGYALARLRDGFYGGDSAGVPATGASDADQRYCRCLGI